MRAADVLARLRADATACTPAATAATTYRCATVNFAAYLIAANLLRYLRTAWAPNGRDVELLFHDPDLRGPDLLRRFTAGATELVNARVLYEVRGYLISEVKSMQAAVRNAD